MFDLWFRVRRFLNADADELKTVDLLGRELTRHTELAPLAAAVGKLLRDHFGAAGVALWLVPRQGEAERLVHQAGAASGPPSRTLPLSSADEKVGRVELWGLAEPRSAPAALLDALVPWLAMSFENARRRERQLELERTLAERTEQLQQSQLKAANSPQELRTPMTLMLTPLESILHSSNLSAEARAEIESVVRSGYRLLDLADGADRVGAGGTEDVLTSGPEAPATPGEDASEQPLLLVAEDSADVRRAIGRCLRDEFRIIEAADGEEALALALERLPDLILSDVMMPRLDGFELCRAVKADASIMTTPVVLLTARVEISDRVEGFRGGADDYVVKPFHPEELRARLRSQLRMRRLSEQVAHSEKLAALGTLVAGVAHEVRNPLNGIINSLGPLKEALKDASPDVAELLDLAIESSKQVEHVSGQLLRQAHVSGGRRAEVNVRANLALALQMLSHKTAGGPTVVTQIPPEPDLAVIGDPGSLHQVWINLVENAIHAAGRSGKVEVALTRAGDVVSVEVADDGPGIEPRLLKRIFDPFFTTKSVGKGTGLGLSLVREIIRKHEGTITVDSHLGAGARFRVNLPAANRTRAAVASAALSPRQPKI